MWSVIALVLRIVAVVWTVVVAVFVAMSQMSLVEVSPKLEAIGWIGSLIFLGGDSLGTIAARFIHKGQRERRDDISAALLPMLTQMSETEKVRFERLGASVYRLARVHLRPNRPRRLIRITRLRPSEYPPKSGASWTTESGNVGRAYASGEPVYDNLYATGVAWVKVAHTRSEFAQLPPLITAGKTFEEFTACAAKYSEMVAVPLFHPRNDSKVVGVLTVDRTFDGAESFTPFLNSMSANRLLAGPQALLASILKPASS